MYAKTVWLNGQETFCDLSHPAKGGGVCDRDWHAKAIQVNRAIAYVEIWHQDELVETLRREACVEAAT